MLSTSLIRIWLTRSFKPFVFKGRYDNKLDLNLPSAPGLYVHIPFCRRLCAFCPYCKQVYRKDDAALYKKALLKEIELLGASQNHKIQATSLYFGGGTPALMLDDLAEIIAALQIYFIITDGIGVELHPDDVCEETLLKLKKAGVTMISIGIQSFDDNCLTALGRQTPDYAKIFADVKAADFATVDMDLIFAIPTQTGESLKNDIDIAFANGATQISTYPFIDFSFAENKQKPMNRKTKKRLLKEISEHCSAKGLKRTSVWTFAKPDTQKYSSITRDVFLGFGLSATSLLTRQFKINTFSLKAYCQRIAQGQLPTALSLDFSLRQRACYYLFWSCYSLRASEQKFADFFALPLKKLYGFELSLARLLGLIKKQKDQYILTERGAYYYHLIEQAYTTAYIDKMWSIARLDAFPKEIILK